MSEDVRRHFLRQADVCQEMGSPFTASLCRLLPDLLDAGTEFGRRVCGWQGNLRDDALALRCCGALHAVILDGADRELSSCYPPNGDAGRLPEVLPAAIARHDARLAAGLDSAPQTNEIARSAVLFPGFTAIARQTGLPMALAEIGASAGLNLLFDRFFYRYGENPAGDPTSAVRLQPELRGPTPDLSGTIRIASRRACDLAPLDVTRPADRLRLRSYVWPDQRERLQRLDAAIGLASQEPITLEKADAVRFLGSALGNRSRGETLVVYHSVMWQYLPPATRDAIRTLIKSAGQAASAAAPLAWLSMESAGGVDEFAALRLTLWPGGQMRRLARCDWHGRWIEWLEQ